MTAYWVGVASREHVLAAVRGGFCQLNHGKEAPLRRLKPGDRLLYYSPRAGMHEGEQIQAFTAIGEVLAGEPKRVTSFPGFLPYRRDIRYFVGREAPIRPLLPHLRFSRGKVSWGAVLRRGTFQIEPEDYLLIAHAMGINDAAIPPESSLRSPNTR